MNGSPTGTRIDERELADRLLHDLPDALVVADAEGRISYWNDGATRVFGFTGDEALGQSLDIIIPENLRERHWAGYEHTMKTGQTKYGAGDLLAVPAICKDGRRISVQFSIFTIAGPDGGFDGIGAVMRDVTAEYDERKRLRMEIGELRRAAKA